MRWARSYPRDPVAVVHAWTVCAWTDGRPHLVPLTKPQTVMAKKTTKQAAARVYSAVAKKHGGQVPKGHYAGRLDAAAKKHETGGRLSSK